MIKEDWERMKGFMKWYFTLHERSQIRLDDEILRSPTDGLPFLLYELSK